MSDGSESKQRKKITFVNILSDNRIVAGISIILAFVCWFAFSMTQNILGERIVGDVALSLDISGKLPEMMGYKLFRDDVADITVNVKVSGPKYLINDSSLSKEDFNVSVDFSLVNSPGEYALELSVSLKSSVSKEVKIDKYWVTGSSEENPVTTVNLYFDEETEKSFTLQSEVKFLGGETAEETPEETAEAVYVPEGFISEPLIVTAESVTLKGSKIEINNVAKVVARIELDSLIEETVTKEAAIYVVYKDGTEYKYNELKYMELSLPENQTSVTVTIPVKKEVTLPISIDYKGVPQAYMDSLPAYTCSPSSIKVAIDPKILEKGLPSLSIATIDFSSLTNKMDEFTFPVTELGEHVLDDVKDIKVTVDASKIGGVEIDEKTISVTVGDNVVVNNASRPVDVIKTTFSSVIIYGPQEALDAIDASGINITVDLSEVELLDGRNSVTARLSVKNSNNCWVYGSYTIEVTTTG